MKLQWDGVYYGTGSKYEEDDDGYGLFDMSGNYRFCFAQYGQQCAQFDYSPLITINTTESFDTCANMFSVRAARVASPLPQA